MKHILFALILGGSLICSAQNKVDYDYSNTALDKVISDIESKNGITFSFALDLIKDKRITLQIDQIDLLELLDILEAQTGLNFRKISESQIIVSPRTESKELCGYLLDAETKLPIPFSTVLINSEDQVTTDKKGFFTLKKREDLYSLKAFGYEQLELNSSNDCRPIYLNPSIEELKEVVVTGYITTGIDRRNDGSIDVTQKTLGILPGLTSPDVLQSAQLIPGIGSLDESASGIQIRGGTTDQNLILFDGIKLFNSGYFYGMFSRFNPYSTEKATIFKSGTSAAYGDRISGIISISSGTEISKKASVGIGLDGLSLDGYIKAPLSDKLAIYAFARSSYTGVYKSPTYNGYAEKIFRNGGVVRDNDGNVLNIITDDEFNIDTSNNEFSFYDVNAKLIYNPSDKDRITISSLFTRNALDFSFTSFGEERLDSLVTKNNGISINWQHFTSSKQKSEIRASFSRYNSYYRNLEVLTNDNALEEINIRANEINDFGLHLATQRSIKENQFFSIGYQLSNTKNKIEQLKEEPFEPEGDFSQPSDRSNLKSAAFGEYTYTTKKNGILSGGLRIVHYSSVGKLFLEPRLNFEHPISKDFRTKASLERRNQPISQLVEFNQTELRLENNLWRLSDDVNYPILQSNQISAGFLYNHKEFTLDIDTYYKRITGLTTYTNGFSTPQLELSSGKSTIAGLDLLLKKRFKNYRIWLGYSYNNITFNFNEIQSTDFPGNNDITHSFRISNSLKINDIDFSLGWQYRTGEPFTPINSFDTATAEVEFGAINSARLQDYHRLDASLVYNFIISKPKNHRMQFGISALNLYSRKIPISIIYRVEDEGQGSQLVQVVQRFSLGFTPNITFRMFF